MSARPDPLAVIHDAADTLDDLGKVRLSERVEAARIDIAALVEAARRVANKRHTHSAIGSPDGGETCGICGSNFRNAQKHFVVGESVSGDHEALAAAIKPFGDPK